MDAPAASPNARPDAPRLRTSMALSQPGRPAARVEKLPATDDPTAQIERRYRDALNMMNKGKVREAMEALYAITRERPEHAAAWQVLVRLLLEQGRPDEAMRVLQEVAHSRPDSLPAALQLARLHAEFGTDAQALQTLLAAQKAGADNADYHGLLANLLQRQKRSAEAAGSYRRALTLRPTEGRWWIGLGLCLEESGQKEEAKAAWRQGLQSGNLPADLRQFAESKLSGG
jgi:MSHA biogenesis protein MshN